MDFPIVLFHKHFLVTGNILFLYFSRMELYSCEHKEY